MVTVNQNATEKISSASLNKNSTEGRVLSVKPKRLHLDKSESRRSRSAAEQNPDHAGAQYVL